MPSLDRRPRTSPCPPAWASSCVLAQLGLPRPGAHVGRGINHPADRVDPRMGAGPIATSDDKTSRPATGQAQAARAAAGEAARAAEATARPPRGRPSDVFGGEVRRRDIFTLLVFH